MDKKIFQRLKERLEKDKAQTEKELDAFAERDDKLKGDWDTRFPKWDSGGSSSGMEVAADEVEEYSRLLPLEHVLENRLRNIELALKKIDAALTGKKGKDLKYGVCEKCGQKISDQRLKIYPEARFCRKCNK